jgi:hypothetical protein
VTAVTRAQRNALAEAILAALHDHAAVATLDALERVLATTGAVPVDAAAAARLRAAGLVTDAVPGDASTAVVLAQGFDPVRAAALDRVARGRRASDVYWTASGAAGVASEAAPDGVGEADLAATWRRAAALFDAQLYFEVHEELEELWRRTAGVTRAVVQGVLQIAVALHHAEGGNVAGARRLLAAGRAKLVPHAPRWRAVAIAPLLAELRRWEHARLELGEAEAAPPRLALE